mmetsp:Transcript_9076/g.13850  ORF Transcript_9076/g.13850 Transcript_9076/m.13850 type:complete len:110 (+) Transcript_9076:117-446(+)
MPYNPKINNPFARPSPGGSTGPKSHISTPLVDIPKTKDENLIMTSEEAFKVIIMLQNKMLAQRTFWDLRYNTTVKKFEEKVQFLENKLSSNQNLWETMKLQDQRQKVLQ